MTHEEREDKINKAAIAYSKFMDVVLPNWKEDPNSKDTPKRVAKMFINELWVGLYGEEPKITVFENLDKYTGIVFQGNIEVKSQCSHHHMPFIGKAHVAYIPSKNGKIIGLSKLNRVVEYFSRRPQVQENLTMQIHDYLTKILGKNLGVAVVIEANHTCVSHRGIGQESTMKTAKLSGVFIEKDNDARSEFYQFVSNLK
ncbi:MAG: GTP cyclohydrolase I [Bacteriovoracaceae bacterium]